MGGLEQRYIDDKRLRSLDNRSCVLFEYLFRISAFVGGPRGEVHGVRKQKKMNLALVSARFITCRGRRSLHLSFTTRSYYLPESVTRRRHPEEVALWPQNSNKGFEGSVIAFPGSRNNRRSLLPLLAHYQHLLHPNVILLTMAANVASKRLFQEYKSLLTNPPDGITAGPVNEDDLFVWEALIQGPEGTPFEGGIFPAELKFPKDYPLNPPKMKFLGEIWHPNGTNTLLAAQRTTSNKCSVH